MRSSKLRNAILVISTILVFVLLGGFVASIVTETPPNEWFKKDDVIIDEPVVEEVLPLVATNEEEMNALLVEENVGRTVTYTGETIKNVQLPFEEGNSYGCMSVDTSLNLDDFLINLDWDNPHASYTDIDFLIEYYVLMTIDDVTIDDCINDFESCTDNLLFFVLKQTLLSSDESSVYVLYFCDVAIYTALNPNFDYDSVDSVPELGWTDWAVENLTVYSCDLNLCDVDSSYMTGDCLFFGPEEGNYGSVEVVYENNVEYQIVANENGDGCHFEKID